MTTLIPWHEGVVSELVGRFAPRLWQLQPAGGQAATKSNLSDIAMAYPCTQVHIPVPVLSVYIGQGTWPLAGSLRAQWQAPAKGAAGWRPWRSAALSTVPCCRAAIIGHVPPPAPTCPKRLPCRLRHPHHTPHHTHDPAAHHSALTTGTSTSHSAAHTDAHGNAQHSTTRAKRRKHCAATCCIATLQAIDLAGLGLLHLRPPAHEVSTLL
jgi:hypothetical protein